GVRNKMVDLTKDFMDGLYYDLEAFKDREAYELGTDAGKEEGIKEGRKEGEKNKSIEIATSMLRKAYTKEEISEIINLSLEEIEEISKRLNQTDI
ncbi:MAG: hypothetical protein NC483_06585, partial [Ruminococcus sp.]|nr:hypothetical protein [Ruminococcus sp.]